MKNLITIIAILALTGHVFAQDTLRNKTGGGYLFTVQKRIATTEVQDQASSGTCWSFSTLSFFESELLRMGKGKHNLSEMFIVNKAYKDKAEKYVRMHGTINFSAGGAFHDIPYVFKNYGIVPEEIYKGLNYGTKKHNHLEMDDVLLSMVKTISNSKKPSEGWKNAVSSVVDSYLGVIPESFEYQGKKYTPKSFSESLGLKLDDYVTLTSFTHHPFYEKVKLEIQDNWNWEESYNVKLDEMIGVIDNALNNGYGVAWASDVSEAGFSYKNGLAIVPASGEIIINGKDDKYFNNAGADKKSTVFDKPIEEKVITQEMRQKAFDNYETTDDHGMHIIGIVKDQNGKKYYIVKNSWGTENDCGGYLYVSEAYVRYKTTDIMLHKNGLTDELKKKLKID